MREHFRKALANIIRHGDTDIFPFPFERHLFEEKQEESLKILEGYHANLEQSISQSPPLTLVKLSQVGYYGFRQATMIEPFWNTYFLGLVISIAEKIERTRINEADKLIFSYRYQWNEEKASLFKDTTWIDYKKQCVEYSKSYEYILQTDISNFYPRINHHKLENELKRIDSTDVPSRILKLLSQFSGTISYGLPVGGPASRILAELALNHTDFHLKSRGIVFCRYADDYSIFCIDESEAYKTLILLSEKLSNDQLGLQKDKTKIMSCEEFREIHRFLDPKPAEDKTAEEEQKLLNISIRFDPYSDTAQEDYEALKTAVREIDIVGILSREVNKTRIDQTVTKQAIHAIKVLSEKNKVQALSILLDHDNLITLSPVFTTIMRATRSIYEELDENGKELIDNSLMHLFKNKSYLTKIEMNLNYIIQILSVRYTSEKETLFIKLFETETNHLLRRQIIIAMTNWNCHYWCVDVKNQFNTLTTWERRAVIYSSYFLGDEGKHWREHNKNLFSKEERLIRDWSSSRKQANRKVLA
ncbi:MAG TPA: RNA-directed DNA polymerase [Cryomorphaceae bacterium]|nr:RNA-directed DNA polymerase [Owenweeksia sp.]HAD98482.1 RNA-directed DNA polymerase [Cryomorphaceae bacterium]|tara:strand:- start:923 stop:2515 length:1593 start_codon:yes stop_codon:yes gene_type:complete